jgi:hypothetical protein
MLRIIVPISILKSDWGRDYLDGFAEFIGLLFAEADSSPFKDLSFLHDVGNHERFIFCEKVSIVSWELVNDLHSDDLKKWESYLFEKVLALLDPCRHFWMVLLMLNLVHFVIELRVLNFQMRLLDQV